MKINEENLNLLLRCEELARENAILQKQVEELKLQLQKLILRQNEQF